jgi:hypothetical protein
MKTIYGYVANKRILLDNQTLIDADFITSLQARVD